MIHPTLTQTEIHVQLIITGLTNFAMTPTLVILYQSGKYPELVLGTWTMFMSFMYHCSDAMRQAIWMNPGQWHRLDNIGAIACFCWYMVYAMGNEDRRMDTTLRTIILCIVVLLQEKAPWDERYTVYPILVCACLPLIKWGLIRRSLPPFRRREAVNGFALFVVAVVCFIKGLNERDDYLRIFHGSWHMMCSFSFYHMWQIIDEDKIQYLEIDPRGRSKLP